MRCTVRVSLESIPPGFVLRARGSILSILAPTICVGRPEPLHAQVERGFYVWRGWESETRRVRCVARKMFWADREWRPVGIPSGTGIRERAFEGRVARKELGAL